MIVMIVMVIQMAMHIMMSVIYVQKAILDMGQIVIYYPIAVIQIMMNLETLVQCYMPVKRL